MRRTRPRPAIVVAAMALVVGALAPSCTVGPRRERTTTEPAERAERGRARGRVERGKASWYGGRFHGRKTASGERFDKRAMTAAHKTLPFGTRVRVTNVNNGKSVIVRINDRGPYGRGRVIDLSEAAARRIGMIEAGVVRVEVEVISRPERRRRPTS